MRSILAIGALSLAAAFGPPARATTQPLVRTDFSPIDFSTTERLDTTRLNYDGTGELQCKIKFARHLLDGVAVQLSHWLIRAQASGRRKCRTTCPRTRPCA